MFHAGRSNAPSVILIVEQDESLRALLCAAFEDEGYQVRAEAHTPSAVEVAEMQPDLMMIDVERNDPRAGWQLVEAMKATPRTAHVPIVVCSVDGAIVAPQDVRARSEAAAILVKPFSLDDLLPVVATALDRRDRDRRDLYRSIQDLMSEPVVARDFGSIGF